jgi:hypothetical protein
MLTPRKTFSPEGTAVNSQGREPLERLQFDVLSPVRGGRNEGSFAPYGAFGILA